MKICAVCAASFEGADWTCPACGWSPRYENGHYYLLEHDEGISGYSGDYFAPLAEIEKDHFWFRARNRLLTWALRRCFPHMRSFLEIGCGTGFVLAGLREAFPAAALAGAEYYAQGLAFARSRVPDATFYQLDARAMPFEVEFDVIGALDVIEHIKEDEAVLAGMYRAVRPGGGIVLTVPQHRFLWSVADAYKHHERRYAPRELLDKVTAAGFRVIYTTSFVSLLLPMMLLSRIRQNRAAVRPDRMTELRINPLANRVLDGVMRAEATLIQAGLRFPAGGSRLLLARKG